MAYCPNCPGCKDDWTLGSFSCKLKQKDESSYYCECPLGDILIDMKNRIEDLERDIYNMSRDTRED